MPPADVHAGLSADLELTSWELPREAGEREIGKREESLVYVKFELDLRSWVDERARGWVLDVPFDGGSRYKVTYGN